MAKDNKDNKCEDCMECSSSWGGRKNWHHYHHHGNNAGGGAVYGLGMIGALVFFISHATSFWMGVWGIVQAILWPAFLVYEALKVLIK